MVCVFVSVWCECVCVVRACVCACACACVCQIRATGNPTLRLLRCPLILALCPMTSDLGWPLHMVLPARGIRALLRPDRVSILTAAHSLPSERESLSNESKTRPGESFIPHKYSHEKETRLSSPRIELRWSENDSAFNCILLTPYHIFIHVSLSLTRSVSPILARPIALRAPQQCLLEYKSFQIGIHFKGLLRRWI